MDLQFEFRASSPRAVIAEDSTRQLKKAAALDTRHRPTDERTSSRIDQTGGAAGRGLWGPQRVAGVALVAASAVSFAAGVTLLALHGTASCEKTPPGSQCDSLRNTKFLGWSFVAGGAAAALGGGVLLYQSTRTNVSLAVTSTAIFARGRF